MNNSRRKKTIVKVTKAQLLGAVHCRKGCNRKLIKMHWPKHRKKVTLIEFVEKAREIDIGDFNIQYVLWKLDYDGWEKVEMGENIATEVGSRNVVNKYLELFRSTEGG